MSCYFRVNQNPIVAGMSKKSLLETCAKSKVKATATELEATTT